MKDMPRLFVAIEIPDAQRELLEDLCFGLPEARFTPFDQLHLTLAFIGEVDGGLARDADEALANVVAEPFSLTLRGVGCFPPRGEPRIAWAGFEPSPPLVSMQRSVARALEHAGCKLEKRKFHPHVTLARLHGPSPERLGAWLAERSAFAAEPFEVTEFCLFSSVLGREGATHVLEATYEL